MAAWLEQIVADAHAALVNDPRAEPARAYLAARGVSPAFLVEHRLGFVFSDQPIAECSESFKEFNWALPDRIVFPLTSVTGQVIGIQTKPLEPKGYQLFYAYPRNLYPYMFGTAQAIEAIWARRSVVIVEGVFDYVAVRQVTPNVVAVMTAGVPQACRHFFRRYVKRVIALLDMDAPGRDGAFSLAVRQASTHYSVSMPEYSAHDPGDLWKAGKLDELRRCVQMAQEPARY